MNAQAAEDHLHVVREELRNDARNAPRRHAEDAVIALDDVWLSFDRPILRGVSLEAHKGETLMVAGESGSGKSTILKLILRLLVPNSGTITVFDKDVGHLSFQEALELRRHIGMVFQNAALFDSLTIYETKTSRKRKSKGWCASDWSSWTWTQKS
jgi:ABC-type transporter Mla maintaining outer membrane lipid asymmetry ATPase subunit MlaF